MAKTKRSNRIHKWRPTPSRFSYAGRYKEAVCVRLSTWKRFKLARLSEAQGHRCCYCCGDTFLLQPGDSVPSGRSKGEMATLEHLIPKCRAVQTNKDENLVMACSLCNGLRGERDPMGFYQSLRAERDQFNVQKPKIISTEKLEKNKRKEGRTLALCLIVFVMFPEESVYWSEHWVPYIRLDSKQKRKNKVRKIVKSMKMDPRRIAA